MPIKIPFQIKEDCVERENDIKKSVDSFIDVIVSTAFGQCNAAPDFGFIFRNYRFENFNVQNNVIGPEAKETGLKVGGNSKNKNTFAFELKGIIEKYDPRLSDIYVDMFPDYPNHNVKITITGNIKDSTQKTYSKEINFNVW